MLLLAEKTIAAPWATIAPRGKWLYCNLAEEPMMLFGRL